jgi:branched-chain amino acid transport system substrate-binding protein
MLLPDVKSLGLKFAGGITLAEGFYWDLDEKTRAFSLRFETIAKQKPSMAQGGAYSATLHYLRAVAAAKTTDPQTVVQKMRELPIRDDVVRNASLRKDGRMVHDYYQFQVKSPGESKGPDDLYTLRATIPAAEAFKPISESTCPLLEK